MLLLHSGTVFLINIQIQCIYIIVHHVDGDVLNIFVGKMEVLTVKLKRENINISFNSDDLEQTDQDYHLHSMSNWIL